MADKNWIVHRWPDGRELTPQELDDRRQAYSDDPGWARSKGYTVAYERQKAAGE